MKKVYAIISLVLILLCSSISTAAGAASFVDSENSSKGMISVNYNSANNAKAKVLIEKSGEKYYYSLSKNDAYNKFSLQMGNGTYTISILENLKDNEYKVVSKENIDVKVEKENDTFLGSVQNINWSSSSLAAQKANEIAKNAQNQTQTIQVIYNYLVNNIKYDEAKLNKLSPDYLPDADTTLKNKKGICYDFSSTFAAMLRSQGIPAKLVKGYSKNVEGYHSWNEVYLENENKWVIIDTSYDSQALAKKVKTSMIKDSKEYEKVYEY
jgi:hypothetical protein